ncbi:hypothetical protein GQ55_2G120300 [Panicum hallii var. hallii]|uniref:Uncharacterized protein n=1 Tax=Panicum hallii var. hallii TaxID=1504633 RepID=A0A2T7EP16_9POAL|nr:hypothetical protein GQ55_2G120300 [Panicum hallii var. hallii]
MQAPEPPPRSAPTRPYEGAGEETPRNRNTKRNGGLELIKLGETAGLCTNLGPRPRVACRGKKEERFPVSQRNSARISHRIRCCSLVWGRRREELVTDTKWQGEEI